MNDNDYLIKAKDRVITVSDFYKALEIAKTAHPHNITQDENAFRAIQLDVLNQLIEEMILQLYADDNNISISDKELLKVVNEIKGDFPDDNFEHTLLENTISFEVWKARLRVNLLIKKIKEGVLEDKIEITQEEMAKFYKEYYDGESLDNKLEKSSEDNNTIFIKILRKHKVEDYYKGWLNTIQKQYNVEINKEVWEKIIHT